MPTPPVAKTVPYTFTHLGRTFNDAYFWLQDKTNPSVIAYLEAENAYARAALEHTLPLQEQLYTEMRGRMVEDDASVPEQHGDYFYHSRVQAGQQYRVFCRKHMRLDAPEETLLDENALAVGKSYCRVNRFDPSPNHRLLAYSIDTTGSLVFDLYIQDLKTGKLLAGPIPNVAWSTAWASDSRSLFYTVFDASHRAYKTFRHTIGIQPSGTQDVLVYHEPDDAFTVRIQRTRSGAYLLMTVASATTSEVYYLPADRPEASFHLIHPRQHWLEYYVEHYGESFFIRTNEDALNFKLMQAPVGSPSKANWREVLPHRADTLLEDIDAFHDHLVLYERQNGLPRIRISAPDGINDVYYIPFPDPVYTFSQSSNPEYATPRLRFFYTSLVTPQSTIDFDMNTRSWQVMKVQEIPSGYDAGQYNSERLFAPAPDGAQVPISLVYRKGFQRDGSHPLLLRGYGSYGMSSEPGFDTRLLSLLDRGFVVALAHIRGGSEMGRAWYENGRLMHKKNSFTDFIACAEHLVGQGYTSPERLAIFGRSAGGLLMGAVANLRPDLFKAIATQVPFTNVITAMLDPDLPLTVVEYEQWGNPNDPQAFDYMLSYSPYENVKPGPYPHIYVEAGLNDLQVPYWDPAKWVAKLRATRTNDSRLLLITHMGSGHGGSSGRYDHLREDARLYAFLIDAVGGQ
jgi:oligopeptidase B